MFYFFSRCLAVLILAGGTTTARAAIANGAPHLIASDASSASSGELFLNVWDETAAISYSYDLGLTVEDFLTTPTARTWTLDQRFRDFAAAGNPLQFNIAANNTYGGIRAAALGAVPSTYGVLSSVLNQTVDISKAKALSGGAGNSLQQLSSPIQARVNALNLNAATANGFEPGDPLAMTDFAAHLSETTDANNDPNSSYFATQWGANLSNRFAFSTTAPSDQGLRLYFFGLQAPGVNKVQATDLGGGSLEARLDVANATLSWGTGGGGGTGDNACALPWGGSLASGQSIPAYQAGSAAQCVSETRTCSNGNLSGSYTFENCTTPQACALPWGGSLASGQSIPAYQAASAAPCVSEVRTCTDGSLSGSYTHASCAAPKSCNLPWGGTLANGESVTAYLRSVDSDCAAGAEIRTCQNSSLSGSAIHRSCSAPNGNPPPACVLPWGGMLASGQSVTAYATATSSNCQGAAETRTCTDGVLGGSFTQSSCAAPVGPAIEILYPKGGEILTVGRKQTIRWNFSQIASKKAVKVSFSKNGGGIWKLVKATKINRSLNWKPTKKQVTETGLIQVCVPKSKTTDQVCGKSLATFTVRR